MADATVETKEATKGPEGVKLEGKAAEFVSWIESISVLELSQLVKALEQRLGVTAAAPVAAVAAAGAGGAGAAPVEEKTEFTVILANAGAQTEDAKVYQRGDSFFLEDVGSRNGTFIKVRGKAPVPVGATVLVGGQLLKVAQ